MGLACQDRREHIPDARDQHRNLEPGEAARCHEGPAHLPKLLARKQHGQWDHVFAKWILPCVQLEGVQTSVSEDHVNAITERYGNQLVVVFLFVSFAVGKGGGEVPTNKNHVPASRIYTC